MLTTPALGRSFKSVKYISTRLCDQDGNWHEGRMHIYLDPRGSAGFACGIPGFIPALLGKYPECGYRNVVFNEIKSGGDDWFVKYPTADELEKAVGAIYRTYAERIREVNKTEFIKINFTGVVPEYDESGSAVWGRWVYKPNVSFGGSAGRSLEIKFTATRGFMVGDKFCIMVDGKLQQDESWSFDGGYRTVHIPFTQETWDQLIEVRETLTKAAIMLGKIFEKPAQDIPALLAGKFATALPAPEPAQPTVKRITRRRT